MLGYEHRVQETRFFCRLEARFQKFGDEAVPLEETVARLSHTRVRRKQEKKKNVRKGENSSRGMAGKTGKYKSTPRSTRVKKKKTDLSGTFLAKVSE